MSAIAAAAEKLISLASCLLLEDFSACQKSPAVAVQILEEAIEDSSTRKKLECTDNDHRLLQTWMRTFRDQVVQILKEADEHLVVALLLQNFYSHSLGMAASLSPQPVAGSTPQKNYAQAHAPRPKDVHSSQQPSTKSKEGKSKGPKIFVGVSTKLIGPLRVGVGKGVRLPFGGKKKSDGTQGSPSNANVHHSASSPFSSGNAGNSGGDYSAPSVPRPVRVPPPQK